MTRLWTQFVGHLDAYRLKRCFVVVALLTALSYVATGVTQIATDEVGLVRRLGCWVADEQGAHLYLPGAMLLLPKPFDELTRVSVTRENSLVIRDFREPEPTAEGQSGPTPVNYLLTGDENLVRMQMIVKYRIRDPLQYFTSLQKPEEALKSLVCSSVTTILNAWSIDEVMAQVADRAGATSVSLADEIRQQTQTRLEHLQVGIEISGIDLNDLGPPRDVLNAFNAVQSARIDQDTWQEEAEGERTEELIAAEAQSHQLIAEATGRSSTQVAEAVRSTSLFASACVLLNQMTFDEVRYRLQSDTLQEVFARVRKTYVVPSQIPQRAIRLEIPEGGPR